MLIIQRFIVQSIETTGIFVPGEKDFVCKNFARRYKVQFRRTRSSTPESPFLLPEPNLSRKPHLHQPSEKSLPFREDYSSPHPGPLTVPLSLVLPVDRTEESVTRNPHLLSPSDEDGLQVPTRFSESGVSNGRLLYKQMVFFLVGER